MLCLTITVGCMSRLTFSLPGAHSETIKHSIWTG